jgi:hypothetical protein
MNRQWEGEHCAVCSKEFDMMSWIDRHEENIGDDWFPTAINYHAECCPSCEQFDSNWIVVDLEGVE